MPDNELIERFTIFLDKHVGLHYPKERRRELEKKLAVIKSSFGFEDTRDCIEWLLNHPMDKKKLDILTFHLTIGETCFFRDSQVFASLEKQIIPDILHRHQNDRSVRIWSTACCTGEEPYSIAILLHKLIPDIKNWKISILGSDINPEFLLKAEKACYKKWSFRTTPSDIRKNYFVKNQDETFSLLPAIQEMVHFRQLNLVDDTYPDPNTDIKEIDLIICHNVLIYFSKDQIKKTIHKLSKSLSNNGWLNVSSIEVPFVSEQTLNSHRYSGAVFFKKESSQELEREPHHAKDHSSTHLKKRHSTEPLPVPLESQIIPVKANVKKVDHIFDEGLGFYKQKAYEEVIALLKPHLTPFQNDATNLIKHQKEVILLIRSYANQGKLTPALEWTEKALQADPLDPMLHYLHATLLQEQGAIPEAIKATKRALFNDTNFVMAYILLGILEKQQDNKKAALRNFKIALELIDHHPHEVILPIEELSKKYLKDLISNNLKTL